MYYKDQLQRDLVKINVNCNEEVGKELIGLYEVREKLRVEVIKVKFSGCIERENVLLLLVLLLVVVVVLLLLFVINLLLRLVEDSYVFKFFIFFFVFIGIKKSGLKIRSFFFLFFILFILFIFLGFFIVFVMMFFQLVKNKNDMIKIFLDERNVMLN